MDPTADSRSRVIAGSQNGNGFPGSPSPAFQAEVPRPEHEPEEEHAHGLEWADLFRIMLVAVVAIAIWFHPWGAQRWTGIIGISTVLIGGFPIFREALENILARRMTMELSMTIALLAAMFIGEFFTALIITLFVLVAEVLEELTVGRGRKAIRELLEFLPQTVSRLRGGNIEEVPAQGVQKGDVLLVRPGEKVPVDGVVLNGSSFIDQAAITGEPLAVEKLPGSEVFAGTINQNGSLEIEAERLGRDTTFGKIIEAVETAERSRAPMQKTADKLAGYLVYFALIAAVITFVITHNVRSTISVIIVAGACGIAAGTPLAVLGAIGRAARMGAIIKGGIYLEALGSVGTILLDKTGTLTFGSPEVKTITTAEGIPWREVLACAVTAERNSEHPLGKAIVQHGLKLGIAGKENTHFVYRPGRGILAAGNGERLCIGSAAFMEEMEVQGVPRLASDGGVAEIMVARAGRYIGSIFVADQVRPEAPKAIEELREMNIQTVLLTGDTRKSANNVAKALKVNQVYSELLPADKVRYVKQFLQKEKVAMLGDGVNDAPALSEATVGIAMGSGTDVAREAADVVLIGNDLSKLVETLRIARKCRRIIMQNFYGTLMVDTVGIGLAAIGILNPLLAVFIHVSSELAFILNSTRLLPSTRQ